MNRPTPTEEPSEQPTDEGERCPTCHGLRCERLMLDVGPCYSDFHKPAPSSPNPEGLVEAAQWATAWMESVGYDRPGHLVPGQIYVALREALRNYQEGEGNG